MDSKTRLAIYRQELSERLWEIENRHPQTFKERITIQDTAFLKEQHIKFDV